MSLHARRKKTKPGLVTYINSLSRVSEQFRSIRTSIEFSQVSKNCTCIVVTSSESGSGKSTVSSNLAISYAQKGKKTLLIDADMRKPRIHSIFEMTNTYGLSLELLNLNLNEERLYTGIENLSILTSGPVPPNSNALLGSENMSTLIEKCKEKFDIVIIDTPPINIVSDASVLLSKIDGVVLVMRCKHTLKKDAKKSIELIKKFEGKLIGGILNDVSEKNKDDFFNGY